MSSITRIAVTIVTIVALGAALYLLAPKAGGSAALAPTPSPTLTSGPVATIPPNKDVPLVPPSPLPDPSGATLAGDLIGRTYAVNPPVTSEDQQLVLTLRGADDPHCMAMYQGRSSCFTVLWGPEVKAKDPGARGPARMVGGNLVLGMALVPFDEPCVGSSATYALEDAGQTLRGIDPPACTFPGFRELGATVCASVPTVFDTRTKAHDFALPMKVTLPAGWKPLTGIVGALGLVHSGCPEGPDSTWWGPDVLLVEDAQIHDSSDVVSGEPATPDRSRYVAWPADFFAYITALPGVEVVTGPEPITIGGVTGTQLVVRTPPMRPLVWMNGDFAPLGGGEPAVERRFVVVETGGHTLFVSFFDVPSRFDARDAEVQAILASITFE